MFGICVLVCEGPRSLILVQLTFNMALSLRRWVINNVTFAIKNIKNNVQQPRPGESLTQEGQPKIHPQSLAGWSSWKGNLVRTPKYEYYAMCSTRIDGYGRKKDFKSELFAYQRGSNIFWMSCARGESRLGYKDKLNIISLTGNDLDFIMEIL